MSTYTISNQNITSDELKKLYKSSKDKYKNFTWNSLDVIFNVASNNTNLFPPINLGSQATNEAYIERWVHSYYESMNNLPSKRTANPKGTCTDPAIRTIVKSAHNLSEKDALNGEITHNLFMSAENIQGNLLEEFISINILPFGVHWCNGNVLRAIDFCNSDGSLLLQIKNKNNTENSSSSNIRVGTSIKKWYRLGSRTVNGAKIPSYKWSELNDLINGFKTQNTNKTCNISEEDYIGFLIKVANNNHSLITSM